MGGRCMAAALSEQAERMLSLQEREGRCQESISLGFQATLLEVCTIATSEAQQEPQKPAASCLVLFACMNPASSELQL